MPGQFSDAGNLFRRLFRQLGGPELGVRDDGGGLSSMCAAGGIGTGETPREADALLSGWREGGAALRRLQRLREPPDPRAVPRTPLAWSLSKRVLALYQAQRALDQLFSQCNQDAADIAPRLQPSLAGLIIAAGARTPMRSGGRRAKTRLRADVTEGLSLLSELDGEYGDILAVLDENAAYRRVIEQTRELLCFDVAWVGVPADDDQIVLRSFVGARARSLNGVVVAAGQGLGGQVLASRRLHSVRDYFSARSITHQFDAQVRPEGLRGMIAAPLTVGNRMFGVLYGANRRPMHFSDRTISAVREAAAAGARAALVAERARHLAEVAVHEERRRLAVELHDSVGAMLFTITAQARGLSDRGGFDDDLRQRLITIEQRAGEAAAKLRESLRMLHASPQEVAFSVALRADCHSFEERTRLPARVLIADLPNLHPSRVKVLIECVREALVNVEKHAQASSVVVTVCTGDGGVYASVVDDGVGLAPRKLDYGLGLQATSDRLEQVRGRLTLSENDEGGLTFRAWVPA